MATLYSEAMCHNMIANPISRGFLKPSTTILPSINFTLYDGWFGPVWGFYSSADWILNVPRTSATMVNGGAQIVSVDQLMNAVGKYIMIPVPIFTGDLYFATIYANPTGLHINSDGSTYNVYSWYWYQGTGAHVNNFMGTCSPGQIVTTTAVSVTGGLQGYGHRSQTVNGLSFVSLGGRDIDPPSDFGFYIIANAITVTGSITGNIGP